MLEPYYSYMRKGHSLKIYVGDAREVLPVLKMHFDAVVTDPVWPNCPTGLLPGAEDSQGLLASVLQLVSSDRLVLQLGCNSDPRFLTAVPAKMPFFRVAYLEYVKPHYQGRLMYGADVAYVFGKPIPSRNGQRVIPGRFMQTQSNKIKGRHPTPRNQEHVNYLFRWYVDQGPVLDPFMGSGTTLYAALNKNVPYIGIEINKKYADMAIERCRQTVLDLS